MNPARKSTLVSYLDDDDSDDGDITGYANNVSHLIQVYIFYRIPIIFKNRNLFCIYIFLVLS